MGIFDTICIVQAKIRSREVTNPKAEERAKILEELYEIQRRQLKVLDKELCEVYCQARGLTFEDTKKLKLEKKEAKK